MFSSSAGQHSTRVSGMQHLQCAGACDKLNRLSLNFNCHQWHSMERGQKGGPGRTDVMKHLLCTRPCPLFDGFISQWSWKMGNMAIPALQTWRPGLGERQ